jgi:hypothetical protein
VITGNVTDDTRVVAEAVRGQEMPSLALGMAMAEVIQPHLLRQ